MITMRCNVCGKTPCVEKETGFGPKERCKAPTSWWGCSSGGGTSEKKIRHDWPEILTEKRFRTVQNNPETPTELRKFMGNTHRLRSKLTSFMAWLAEAQDDGDQPWNAWRKTFHEPTTDHNYFCEACVLVAALPMKSVQKPNLRTGPHGRKNNGCPTP